MADPLQTLGWQQQAMADGERIGLTIVPPCVQPACAPHCWHTRDPRVSEVPGPRLCCWCGEHEGPAHGPYAEG
jgi:hypothetical protein